MAYCTVDDVQSYLTYIVLTDTSQPTRENVSNLCDNASDNLIDPIIRNYITLPLTDTVGINYLKQGAIWFVLSNVYRGLQGFEAVVIELEDKFKDFISALKTNNALLIQPNNDMPKSAHSTRRDVVFHTDPDEQLW